LFKQGEIGWSAASGGVPTELRYKFKLGGFLTIATQYPVMQHQLQIPRLMFCMRTSAPTLCAPTSARMYLNQCVACTLSDAPTSAHRCLIRCHVQTQSHAPTSTWRLACASRQLACRSHAPCCRLSAVALLASYT